MRLTIWFVVIALTVFGLTVGCDESSANGDEDRAAAESESAGDDDGSDTDATRVLLFADLAKEDSSCGCGQLIRMSRMTSERGVPVEEYDKGDHPELLERYEVTADPTVLIVDGDDEELHRFEGEDDETLDAVREQLHELADQG